MIFPHRNHSHLPQPIFRIVFSAFCTLVALSACGMQLRPASTATATPVHSTFTPTTSSTPTDAPTQTPYVITATSEIGSTVTATQGTFFLSLPDSGYFHLFAYSPQNLPLVRLTKNTGDDITPAISPDGKWLAYASNQNSYWDLYLLELASSSTVRLTDTLEYDAEPSWSPDGAFLAYESYHNGYLGIFIRSVTDSTQVYPLTQDSATDTSPAWSPIGRQIAYISNRSGEPEVWIANLDKSGDDKFSDISLSPQTVESHPVWSPDGNRLAWAATDPASGMTGIYIWDAGNPTAPARWAGSGDWPIWKDNDHLVTRLTFPNQTFLTGYSTNGTVDLPPVLLPGTTKGLTFGNTIAALPGPFEKVAQITPDPLFNATITPQSDTLPGRAALVALTGVQAPYPQLNELAYNSFQSLRAQVARETGWDALASLENAYVPLTTSLDPGLGEDWLYTGRAFTLNPSQILANWMVIIREDFGQQTYWRIYLRTTAQDGSQGAPLTQVPWDFSARTAGPVGYENGGQLSDSIPPGYWVDLTSLAFQYGWGRLPALTDWRTYYAGARFNELAYTQGLNWYDAMLQLYSPEFLITPTMVIPPTRTSTRTPMWYRSPTPTATPSPRPTYTP